MSDVQGGWRAHPDAIDQPVKLPPVKRGRVVGIGAICDISPQRSGDARSQSFSVSEFATLEDGRRLILHEDRGFTLGLRSTGRHDPGDLRHHETPDSIMRNVLNVVLPDDDESAEEHPWLWLAELARTRGLDVSAEHLRSLPYEVVITDKLRRWLLPGGP